MLLLLISDLSDALFLTKKEWNTMAYKHPSNENWPTLFIFNKMLKILEIVLILKFSGFVSTSDLNAKNVKNDSIINEDDAYIGLWDLKLNETSSPNMSGDGDELQNFLEIAYQNFSYLYNENLTIDQISKNSFEGVFLDEKVRKNEREIFNSHEVDVINSGNRTLKRTNTNNEYTETGVSAEQISNVLTIKPQFDKITSRNSNDSYLIKDDDDGKIVFSPSEKNNKFNENLWKNNQKISKPSSVQPVLTFETTNEATSSVKDKLVSLNKVKRAKTTAIVKHAIPNSVVTDNNNSTNYRKIIYDSLPINKNSNNLIKDIKTTETAIIDLEFNRNDSSTLDYDENFLSINNITEEEHLNLTAQTTSIVNSVKNNSDSPIWPVKHNAIVEGDVILGGLMMVHSREDTITCGPIMPQGGIQALETMLFTLDIINRGDILPNISLGAHILDDCDKDTYGLEIAVDFIKGKNFFFYIF